MTETEKELLEVIKNQNQTIAALREELSLVREQMDELMRRMFGRSKETLPELDGQLSLFDVAPTPKIEKISETEVKSHKRKKIGTKADKLANLPAKEIIHELPEKERFCGDCDSALKAIGTEIIREEPYFIPARVEKHVHKRMSYCCVNCDRKGKTSIKKAKVPKMLVSASLGSASIIAETMRMKFEQKVPAYRQDKFWKSVGLDISRDNICNWHIIACRDALDYVVERMRHHLIASDIIHADETTYRVIESDKEKTHYWSYSTGKYEPKQIALYHHAETRGAIEPTTYLSGFKGYIHSDGWTVYEKVEGAKVINCWAHVRRKFFEAIPKQNNTGKPSLAEIAVSKIDWCFRRERQWAKMTPEDRLKKRRNGMKRVLNNFYRWLESLSVIPKSKFGEAVNYALGYKEGLYRIFDDGRLELSNNHAERMIKEAVMGRKNWLFSTSLEGAQSAGTIFSVMKTAELNNLNVWPYFQHLFEKIPNLDCLSVEAIDDLLPWSENIQKQFRKQTA